MKPEEINTIYSKYYASFSQPFSTIIDQVVSTKGATITTTDYSIIDLASGNFGYSHPDVISQVKIQIEKIGLSSKIFFSEPLANLVTELSKLTNNDLTYAYPCNSPSEAVEGALKLVKGVLKKKKIIALQHSFHGHTIGALNISGNKDIQDVVPHLIIDTCFVNHNDLNSFIKAINTKKIAAVVLETIDTSYGVTPLDMYYLKEVDRLCKKNNIILIVDESTTGMGRTGTFFSFETYGITPDIVIIGNTLGGNIFPYGVYLTKKWINDKVYKKKDPALHGGTTAGHPIGCIAALETLKVLTLEKTKKEIITCSEVIARFLLICKSTYPLLFGTFYSLGLLGSIKVRSSLLLNYIQQETLKMGALIRVDKLSESGYIVLNPPLIITKEELKEGLDILLKTIEKFHTQTYEQKQYNKII